MINSWSIDRSIGPTTYMQTRIHSQALISSPSTIMKKKKKKKRIEKQAHVSKINLSSFCFIRRVVIYIYITIHKASKSSGRNCGLLFGIGIIMF